MPLSFSFLKLIGVKIFGFPSANALLNVYHFIQNEAISMICSTIEFYLIIMLIKTNSLWNLSFIQHIEEFVGKSRLKMNIRDAFWVN
jgi:hypothetical protein